MNAKAPQPPPEDGRYAKPSAPPPPPPPPRRMSQVAREVCVVLRPVRNVPYTVGEQNYLTPEEAVVAILRRSMIG